MSHKYTVNVDNYGNARYYKDDKWHRDGDKPAVIGANGTVVYLRDGKRHRDGDEPAVIYADGSVSYYKNGERYEP